MKGCHASLTFTEAIVLYLDLQLSMQSVPMTTIVVGSNPAHGEVCWIQHYVIKVVGGLRRVDDDVRILRFALPKT